MIAGHWPAAAVAAVATRRAAAAVATTPPMQTREEIRPLAAAALRQGRSQKHEAQPERFFLHENHSLLQAPGNSYHACPLFLCGSKSVSWRPARGMRSVTACRHRICCEARSVGQTNVVSSCVKVCARNDATQTVKGIRWGLWTKKWSRRRDCESPADRRTSGLFSGIAMGDEGGSFRIRNEPRIGSRTRRRTARAGRHHGHLRGRQQDRRLRAARRRRPVGIAGSPTATHDGDGGQQQAENQHTDAHSNLLWFRQSGPGSARGIGCTGLELFRGVSSIRFAEVAAKMNRRWFDYPKVCRRRRAYNGFRSNPRTSIISNNCL